MTQVTGCAPVHMHVGSVDASSILSSLAETDDSVSQRKWLSQSGTYTVHTQMQELKQKISARSKRNFLLERDVRYLDNRIALLIANRMGEDDMYEMEPTESEQTDLSAHPALDDQRIQQYSNLFFLLFSEPRLVAILCSIVSNREIDMLLQLIMFTIYSNQYEEREEHLLLTMFHFVLSSQFKAATNFNSLLRANTPVSRMLTTYTHRGPGQAYLRKILVKHIVRIMACPEQNLDIEPRRVYDELAAAGSVPSGLSLEDAEALPAVRACISERAAMLVSIATDLLADITTHINLVPYGLRWICKQIRFLARRQYPEASNTAVCSLVGAFFFLRFVNPALVTPDAMRLVDEVPAPFSRRTLTMLAKMIQALVNSPTCTKETCMQAVQPFVDNHREQMLSFLQKLCNVGDFYDTLALHQHLALSRRDLRLSISVNELTWMHTLLLEHLIFLAPDPSDRLAQILKELGPPLEKVPRKENYTLELQLFSRWETDMPETTSSPLHENNISQSDTLYMETKAAFVQLLRALPEGEPIPQDIATVAERAAKSRNAVVASDGERALRLLHEFKQLRTDAVIQQSIMKEEVVAELNFLGNKRDKMMSEMDSLREVLDSIDDHYVFLCGQLETYKSYLQNIRMLSGTKRGRGTLGVKHVLGPDPWYRLPEYHTYRLTYAQLERENVLAHSTVPEERRPHIYFQFTSPSPGSFLIALHYRGRLEPIIEMDLKIDDLLEKEREGVIALDFEYVQLRLTRLHTLLKRLFGRRR